MPWVHRGVPRRVSGPLPRPDAPPGVRAGRRVLLLRTFKDPRADIVVLTALAAALEAQDQIVLVGDGQDKAAISDGWQRILGPEPAFDRQVSYVRSSEQNWRAAVLREICVADAIVLHLSPKDLAFPPVSRPPNLRAQFPPEPWANDCVPSPRHRSASFRPDRRRRMPAARCAGAPLSNVFFYVTGLRHQGIHGREALRNAYPRGKCQSCGRTHDLG
jgi:hypothetical protein